MVAEFFNTQVYTLIFLGLGGFGLGLIGLCTLRMQKVQLLVWGMLTIAGPLLALAMSQHHFMEPTPWDFQFPLSSKPGLDFELREHLKSPVQSDRGNPIRTMAANDSTPEITHLGYLSETGQPTPYPFLLPYCNCHGWIFTGGRYVIPSEEVGKILSENGYREVSTPCPNDLAIYYDKQGKVLHSGIVRSLSQGVIWVESKWGMKGLVLLHPHDRHVYYSSQCVFFRSLRLGHQLAERRVEEQPLPNLVLSWEEEPEGICECS